MFVFVWFGDPVDASVAGDAGFQHAVKLTQKGDTIFIYHAHQAHPKQLGDGPWITEPHKDEHLEQYITEKYSKLCKEKERQCIFTFRNVDSLSNRALAQNICKVAKNSNVDNVVIGMGASSLDHAFLGSVSLNSATYCECPVTIVKNFSHPSKQQ